MPSTRGPRKPTRSLRRNAPQTPQQEPSTPLKVGKIVADCLEVTPRLMNPIEVRTGARLHRPDLPEVAVIDVINLDDGAEYQILVTRKR